MSGGSLQVRHRFLSHLLDSERGGVSTEHVLPSFVIFSHIEDTIIHVTAVDTQAADAAAAAVGALTVLVPVPGFAASDPAAVDSVSRTEDVSPAASTTTGMISVSMSVSSSVDTFR